MTCTALANPLPFLRAAPNLEPAQKILYNPFDIDYDLMCVCVCVCCVVVVVVSQNFTSETEKRFLFNFGISATGRNTPV